MKIICIDAQTGKETDITELAHPLCPVRIYKSFSECFPLGSSATYTLDGGLNWNHVSFGHITRPPSRIGRARRRGKR